MNSHSLTTLNQRLCSSSILWLQKPNNYSKPYDVGFASTITPIRRLAPPSLNASAGGATLFRLKIGSSGLNRLRSSSNGGQFVVSGSLDGSPEPSFVEFITSERVKVVAMLALALALCNADRVVMSVAIVPLSMSRGWGPSFSGVVQVNPVIASVHVVVI